MPEEKANGSQGNGLLGDGEGYNSGGNGGGSAPPTPPAAAAEQSLAEVLIEVRKLIIDILNLPEADQRRAFKRLYLLWHPDKNRASFASAVFM